jgi:transposase-like protein
MSKLSVARKNARLRMFFDGILEGKTIAEIAGKIGIKPSSLSAFLTRHWDGKMPKR